MNVDASEVRENVTLEADVCIVGAGPAGITLARELVSENVRVMCLESGGLDNEEAPQSLNEGEVSGTPYAGLRKTRHRQAGGCTNVWNTPLDEQEVGAKLTPLDSWDFGGREWIEHGGWPFDAGELRRFYQQAQTVCGLGPFCYDGDHWCDESATFALPDARLRRAVYQFGPAAVFADRYVRELLESDNVQLMHHATACGLTFRRKPRSAISVEVSGPAGNRFRVGARFFVLAAGAIENARLLLVSRDPGDEAAGNEYDWVGRCFMEHARDRSLSLLPRDAEVFAQCAFYDRHPGADGTIIGGRLGLDGRAVADERLVSASVSLLPLAREPSVVSRMMRRIGVRRNGYCGYGWSRAPRLDRNLLGFRAEINVEQGPHPENRVVLARTRDRFGVPIPALHWRWRHQDQQRLDRVRRLVIESLTAAGVGRVEFADNVPPDPNAHHHAGTTRMHARARSGVVDPDARVHDTDNLYVAGASSFPTAGFANPTLTIVALALRLAEHLRQRM